MHLKPKMTIIGFGRMGHFYTKVFAEGFDVQVVSSREVKSEVESLGGSYVSNTDEAVGTSDYIFVCVPVDTLDSVIDHINSYARPNAVVIDTCSARVAAEEKLSQLKCRHFGIHASAVVGPTDPVIIDYLEEQGYKLQAVSASEHDRQNATVGLVHFIIMAFDSYLQDKDRRELMSGTVGPLFLKIVDHIRSNSQATYRETQLLNPFMKERRKEFLRALLKNDQKLEQGEFPFGD